jgi:flagellar basal-body rod modification protein FlgD
MPVSLEFDLGADARQGVVSIYDASGKFVREQVMTGLAAGRQNLTWDGKDSQGNPVSKGVYSFEVIANGPKNEKIVVTPFARGRVTGVTFDNDTPLLLVGGRRVAFADVLQVSQAEAAAQRE